MCSSSISEFFSFSFKSQRRTLCIHPEKEKSSNNRMPLITALIFFLFLFSCFVHRVSTGSERRIISSSPPHPSGTLPSHCGMGRQHPLCCSQSTLLRSATPPDHQLRDVHTQTYHFSLSVFTRKKHISSKKKREREEVHSRQLQLARYIVYKHTHTRAESIPSRTILSGKEV